MNYRVKISVCPVAVADPEWDRCPLAWFSLADFLSFVWIRILFLVLCIDIVPRAVIFLSPRKVVCLEGFIAVLVRLYA